MFLLCLNIFSQFVHVIATGWDNELDPIEGFYLFSILFWIIITLLVFELIKWPRPKAQMNSWKVVHGFAVVYLMAIIAMGFFRSEVVAYYVAMYQQAWIHLAGMSGWSQRPGGDCLLNLRLFSHGGVG